MHKIRQNGDMRLMFYSWILISFSTAWGQDERLFRELFLYDLKPVEKVKTESISKANFMANGPYYQIDLNDDGKKDGFVFEKRDGTDWLHFFDQDQKLIRTFKLTPKGYNSNVFKLRMSQLSAKTKLIEVFYYQGLTKYTRLDSTAQVLLITIDDQKFESMSLYEGPEFFQEARDIKQNYTLREYDLYSEDLDQDGIKEYVTKFGRMSKVFKYVGNGIWKKAI